MTAILESTQALYSETIRGHILSRQGQTHTLLTLVGILEQLGARSQANSRADELFKIFSEQKKETAAAELVGETVERWGVKTRLLQLLDERSGQMAAQLRPHVRGDQLLDFGCGDGQVSCKIGASGKMTLYDVIDYRAPIVRNSDRFIFTNDRSKIAPNSIDCAISGAVLHHTENPNEEIAFLASVARRVVVIESVLSEKISFATQATVDWLYNRGFHPGANIPVPGNFRRTIDWIRVFEQKGFNFSVSEDFGIDCRVVPEHHVLLVFDRQKI